MNNQLQSQEKFYDYVYHSIIKNKKISHAYLIEVANIPEYMEYINEFIKILLSIQYENDIEMQNKISIQIDEKSYPDLKIIQPEGAWIKKDQLINLEMEFSKKSMLDNKLIYIIDKAENLNDSSANTILKFLEEPQEDIIAILLTNNRYQVLDTIISRCQILNLVNQNIMDADIDSNIKSFIMDISENANIILNFDKYMKDIFIDRETSKKSLNILENCFCKFLNQNNVEDTSDNILKNMDNNTILKYINIFITFKSKLQYNVNLKLWLTSFLIKIMEVN